jgi:hypothetical protein
MRSRREWYVLLSVGLAMLGVSLLLTRLGTLRAQARGISDQVGNPWPLTADGRYRFAGWSPDGRTVLGNRWGAVVGSGATRQVLSELWAVNVQSDPSAGSGHNSVTRLSENAVQPVRAGDGRRLAVLAFVEDGHWEVRVLDSASGREEARTAADWRTPPAWVGGKLAFVRDGQMWVGDEGAVAVPVDLPALPAGVRVRLSTIEGRVAWSDGTHLWAIPGLGEEPRLLVAPHPLRPLSPGGKRGKEVRVMDFAWSPDGRRLAYVVVEDLSPALWEVRRSAV